jgi:hypothetical protein
VTRSCVDGPVFRGDLVRWDDVGTVPFDALGAPGWKPRPQAKPQPADRPQAAGRPGQPASGKQQPGRARTGPAAGPGTGRSHGR